MLAFYGANDNSLHVGTTGGTFAIEDIAVELSSTLVGAETDHIHNKKVFGHIATRRNRILQDKYTTFIFMKSI